ncbi:MAG: UDP-glucose 4-epimerase GalE [bacterium]|nr:UDP-glucose 4-epimerase GalE [bacterium]
MRVLVTGGAGYIGSHTTKALFQAGVEPIVYDDLSKGHRWAVQWGRLIHADLANASALRLALEEVDAVIHFAANAYVGESVKNPRKYFQNNVVNALSLLDAMLDAGVRKIVFSSTCATYGVPNRTPISEDQPQRPVNPYGESKLFVERALRWYGDAYGLRWITLRYFNAAGADPEGEIGECHVPETHLVPLAIQTALGLLPVLDVFGTDFSTADGTAVRDYVHVTDLADAHVRALYALEDGLSCQPINLGTGVGASVRDVIRTVQDVGGCTVNSRQAPRRPGDPAVLVADPSRAATVLGWKPRLSSLHRIVETAWDWHSRSKSCAQSKTQSGNSGRSS